VRYLITGGAGFIGSHLVDALTARGDDVLVLDDLSTGSVDNLDEVYGRAQATEARLGSVDLIEGCATDEAIVDDCMSAVDACVHLASAVGVQLVIERPVRSLLRNVRGCDNVISAAARHGRRLLFASTSEIYGKNSGESLDEVADRILGSPFQSRWSYSTAKAFGEALAHGYHTQDGADTIVVRLFNTVGPRQTGAYGMVLPRFVRQALLDEDLTVYGSGTQLRCFIHVLDTVHALVLLLDSEDASGKAYNVGSRSPVPIIELAGKVIEQAGSGSRITMVPYEDAYGPGFEELGDRIPNTSALTELTGWRPTRGVEEMIDDVIAHEQDRVRGSDQQVVHDLVPAAG
jgi:UDP-glucose 4-epimerase